MTSTVYFMDLRATPKENLFDKLGRLMETAGLPQTFRQRDLVAVKLHFGETGNVAYVRPVYLRKIVAAIRDGGGKPFLTDANTLYAGTRGDAPNHLATAVHNGFAHSVTDAPVIIADGLRGRTETGVPVGGKHVETAWIGSEIMEADSLVSVAHFKGHELAGFGGAIKNLGMGCASRRGKLDQHSGVSPFVKAKKCVGCGDCAEHCAQDAIVLEGKEDNQKARIVDERCIGCGECLLICPNGAISVKWEKSIPTFLEKMVEYTAGVIRGRGEKCFYLNFITTVSPACDCHGHNDAPIVRDIGVLAGRDPVAIDAAAVDLVNAEPVLAGSCLDTAEGCGPDKFKALYPKVDWPLQLDYAETLGLGQRAYELITI